MIDFDFAGPLSLYLRYNTSEVETDHVLSYMVQIFQGMAYLENRQIVHRGYSTTHDNIAPPFHNDAQSGFEMWFCYFYPTPARLVPGGSQPKHTAKPDSVIKKLNPIHV